MNPMVNIAVRAARGAGSIIVRNSGRLDRIQIERKGTNDVVSEVDRLAEQEIVATLQRAYPSHAIVGEESGGEMPASGHVWVVDPLDGTRNFVNGFPHYAVSIALLQDGVVVVGVIYDPVRDELFTATRGGGATLEGRRLRITPQRSLKGMVIGTGVPFKQPEHMAAYRRMLNDVLQKAADIRRTGSAALDLAYVAANRLDGFWELDLSRWDMAAGLLLIREAGGLVSDTEGHDDALNSGDVVAGSPKLFRELLQTVHPHRIRNA